MPTTAMMVMSNLQAMAAREAIRRLGESNGKDRAAAQKLARIGLILDSKVMLYEKTRRNLIVSNTVKDEAGNILYHDEYQQTPRTRWEMQMELADLDNEEVRFRCETLTLEEVGEQGSNMLISLNPLLAEPLLSEIESE